MHLESLLMDLANRSIWDVFLEEEVDLCTEASMNCTRSVSFLSQQDIAHDADREGILLICSHDHMQIGSVISPLYCIFTHLSHAYANQGICLSLCEQPMKLITNSLVSDHVCG